MSVFKRIKNILYKKEEILAQLDECAEDYAFPSLDNGYVYLADSRLSLYRTSEYWAIIIEVVGFNPRAGGLDSFENCLYVFGNCLSFKPGINNSTFIYSINDGDTVYLLDNEESEIINPKAEDIKIRNKNITINLSQQYYISKNIDIIEQDKIYAFELLRGLVIDYNDLFWATDKEINKCFDKPVPLFGRFEDWHHPDISDDELPSQTHCFNEISLALEKGIIDTQNICKDGNTHWKNWPESGLL